MTDKPDVQPLKIKGTDALQDGWVTPSKVSRKSALSISPRGSDSKKENGPWDKVQDGWDKPR